MYSPLLVRYGATEMTAIIIILFIYFIPFILPVHPLVSLCQLYFSIKKLIAYREEKVCLVTTMMVFSMNHVIWLDQFACSSKACRTSNLLKQSVWAIDWLLKHFVTLSVTLANVKCWCFIVNCIECFYVNDKPKSKFLYI